MQHRSFIDSMVGKMVFVAGWGKTREINGTDSTLLQHIQLPVIDNEQCKEKYRIIGKLKANSQFDDHVLCAGFTEGAKDACQGTFSIVNFHFYFSLYVIFPYLLKVILVAL